MGYIKMKILILNNKSITANTYYRIIFSIIIGLLFSFSLQLPASAQTVSTSASDPSAKTLGYGQYTKDGRAFAKLTPEEVKGLNDEDFDVYFKWEIAKKHERRQQIQREILAVQASTQQIQREILAVQASTQQIQREILAVQASTQQIQRERQVLQAKLISTQLSTLQEFIKLSTAGNTNSVAYKDLKSEFRKILLSGEPAELLPKLEPLRSILMSPDNSAPR
jgi:hypothetical protein